MNAKLSTFPKALWALAFVSLLFIANLGYPQGLIVPNEWARPEFRTVELVSQDINADIVDGTARVTVEQVFRNPNSWQLEGTYIFPLPKDAVVSSFLLIQDGKEWAAELMEADQARQIYQQIVHQRRDPALLEYMNQKMFKASIFPIPPGGERTINLTYSQLLDYRDGLYVWGFPFPNDCRSYYHHPEVRPILDESFSGRTMSYHTDLRFDVSVETQNDLGNVYSPQSLVTIDRKDSRHAHASFHGDFWQVRGPFQIYYSLADKHFGMSLLAHRDGKEGSFLLMISPQRDLEQQEISGKDIVFVVDRSGSMRGEKLLQAKEALKYCLKNLRSDDRFNIISFSDDVRAFRNELVSARDQRKEGIRFAEGISVGGGTNIYDALRRAVGMDWDESGSRAIIFLTDGLPTVGTTNLEAILKMVEDHNQYKVRVFPFGVGHDVDAIFLDRLAKNHRGATEYVEPKENIETAVTSFYNRIQHPVLSDPELEFQGIEVDMVYPAELPDLFAGNQLLVLGRFTGRGEHQVVLTGEVNGRERSIRHTVNFPKEELNNEFIDKLWASRRIGFLLEEIRLHGENKELKDEVIALSKENGIATPYTSFLVREDQHLANLPSQIDQSTISNVRDVLQSLPGVHVDQEGEFHFRGGRSHEVLPQIDGLSGRGSSGDKKAESIHASEAIQMLKEKSSIQEEGAVSFKRIQGRTFEKRGEEWVETSYTEKDSTINIKYDSKAYWELVNELPDLAQVFALGEKLVLKVGKVYVKIGDAGRESIERTEIRAWM